MNFILYRNPLESINDEKIENSCKILTRVGINFEKYFFAENIENGVLQNEKKITYNQTLTI